MEIIYNVSKRGQNLFFMCTCLSQIFNLDILVTLQCAVCPSSEICRFSIPTQLFVITIHENCEDINISAYSITVNFIPLSNFIFRIQFLLTCSFWPSHPTRLSCEQPQRMSTYCRVYHVISSYKYTCWQISQQTCFIQCVNTIFTFVKLIAEIMACTYILLTEKLS